MRSPLTVLLAFIVVGVLVAVVMTPWEVITATPGSGSSESAFGHSIKFSPLWSEPEAASQMSAPSPDDPGVTMYAIGAKGLGNVHWGYFALEVGAFAAVGAVAAIVLRGRRQSESETDEC